MSTTRTSTRSPYFCRAGATASVDRSVATTWNPSRASRAASFPVPHPSSRTSLAPAARSRGRNGSVQRPPQSRSELRSPRPRSYSSQHVFCARRCWFSCLKEWEGAGARVRKCGRGGLRPGAFPWRWWRSSIRARARSMWNSGVVMLPGFGWSFWPSCGWLGCELSGGVLASAVKPGCDGRLPRPERPCGFAIGHSEQVQRWRRCYAARAPGSRSRCRRGAVGDA